MTQPCKKLYFSENQKSYIVPFFLETAESSQKPLILVIPGGGYNHYGTKEQDIIARKFNSLGFSSAILYYTLEPTKFPESLIDLAKGIMFLKKNAHQFNISTKIILCGFSAGGHLAACLGCFWSSPLLQDFLSIPKEETSFIKPEKLCLCYPVVTSDKNFRHEGSISALTKNLSLEEAEKIAEFSNKTYQNETQLRQIVEETVSIEKNINKNFPPTFIWHTKEDQAVPAENTILLARALKENNIDFEYHLFNKGLHGLSLAENTPAGIWTTLFINWLGE